MGVSDEDRSTRANRAISRSTRTPSLQRGNRAEEKRTKEKVEAKHDRDKVNVESTLEASVLGGSRLWDVGVIAKKSVKRVGARSLDGK